MSEFVGAGRPMTKLNADSFTEAVGVLIRSRRQELGMTVYDVAGQSGGMFTPTMVSTYERGVQPGIARFLALCLVLRVRPDDLLPKYVTRLFGRDCSEVDLKVIFRKRRRKS